MKTIYIPRCDQEFQVEYDPHHHDIDIEVAGEAFDPSNLFIDKSPFGSLQPEIVSLKSYLLERAHLAWEENDGQQAMRDAAIEARSDERAGR